MENTPVISDEVHYSPSLWSNRNTDGETVLSLFLTLLKERSEEAKSTLDCDINVPYGDGPMHKLDIFGLNVLPSDSPILVFIHGGYWQEGSHTIASHFAPMMVEAGVVYIALGYDLAPQAQMHQVIESVRQGLTYICGIARNQKPHARSVFVCGHSAGAHLPAITLLAEGDYSITPAISECVKGIILVSGLYDLQPLINTPINEPLEMNSQTARLYSPQFFPIRTNCLKGDKSVIVAYGEHDPPKFKLQSQEYSLKLRDAGVNVTLTQVSDVDHFDVVKQLHDAKYSLSRDILEMIKKNNKIVTT